jgi:hypothetical protein
MTHSAKVTWGKEHGLQRQVKDNSAPRTLTERMSRMRRWISPECNNGVRDRGLNPKLQGSMRIKDLGGRLPLCPRNERTSSWAYRKIIHSVEAKGRIFRQVAENQGLDLVEGSTPSKKEKRN